MWKTASASPPSGGRRRLLYVRVVADPTPTKSKNPAQSTKIALAGTCSPFYPSHSREVSVLFIYSYL